MMTRKFQELVALEALACGRVSGGRVPVLRPGDLHRPCRFGGCGGDFREDLAAVFLQRPGEQLSLWAERDRNVQSPQPPFPSEAPLLGVETRFVMPKSKGRKKPKKSLSPPPQPQPPSPPPSPPPPPPPPPTQSLMGRLQALLQTTIGKIGRLLRFSD